MSEKAIASIFALFFLAFITVTADAFNRTGPKNSRQCICGKEECLHFLDLSDKRSVFHKNDQELIGLLTARQGSFILALEQPVCIRGTGNKSESFGEALDWPQETLLHVAPSGVDTTQYSHLVGSRVRIIGYPFVAFSAWHKTPVLFEAIGIHKMNE